MTELSSRLRVRVTRQLPGIDLRLSTLFDAVLSDDDRSLNREELVAAMADCDVLVPWVADRIDAEMIAQAGGRLRMIANFGAGTDHLDLAACRAAGIVVTNTPDVFTEDTADLTMALILCASRRLVEGAAIVSAGEWNGWGPSRMLGRALGNKVLGIVGMGRIGQALARRARAFGMNVVYNNRRRMTEEDERDLGVDFEPDLDRLIASSDYLSLNCPVTPETKGLLGAERIAAMKPGSFVINSGRGDLIDEDALIAALESGHLFAAGLDVYLNEPNIDPRFLTLLNVVTIPHMGSATIEGRTAAGEKIIGNILAWARGETPPDLVA